MNYLITGGAGFIGSNYLCYVVNKYCNDNFICLDALTYAGNYSNLNSISNSRNFTFIKGNINNATLLNEIFDKYNIDVVVNFSAETHVDNSIKNPSIFLETNILGTYNLLEMSKKYKIKRFHQISTDEVYGDLPLDAKEKFDEKSNLKPSSPYSASKASADMLVLSYFRTYGVPVTISRCSNNYGPFQFPEKLIPKVIENALANKEIPVYGNGENIRDWIYVIDHVKAVDKVVRNGIVGEIYNISGNCEKSNLEVIYAILKQLGKPTTLIKFVEDRLGHDLKYSLDSNKIKNELGFKCETEFEEGISQTINWYLNNLGWLKDIETGKYRRFYDD